MCMFSEEKKRGEMKRERKREKRENDGANMTEVNRSMGNGWVKVLFNIFVTFF